MRLPGWLARARWDRERARELESYLDIETADNIARGMARLPPDAARRKLGQLTRIREEIHAMKPPSAGSIAWATTFDSPAADCAPTPDSPSSRLPRWRWGSAQTARSSSSSTPCGSSSLPVQRPHEIVEVRDRRAARQAWGSRAATAQLTRPQWTELQRQQGRPRSVRMVYDGRTV